MKFFNKTSLALALSLLGVASTMSALALTTDHNEQHHDVMVEAEEGPSAKIMISIDGEVNHLTVSKQALKNKELLAEELANEPAEVREKLLSALGGLHINSENMHIKHHQVEGDIEEQRVVIMTMDDEIHHDENMMVKVVKDMSQLHIDSSKHGGFEFLSGGKIPAESIIRLLSHGKYSAEELDQLQQAIDSKR